MRFSIEMSKRNLRIGAGILAIMFYGIHAAVLVANHEAYHVIWSCHLGCLMVGIGLVALQPWLHSIGFLWLIMGVPLWILNVLTSRDFMVTSTLSHIGGMIIAIYGFRQIKMPKFSWIAATLGLIALGTISRLITPEHANVNLSHAVWAGWEDKFPSYFWYLILLLSVAATTFFVFELLIRRLAHKSPAEIPSAK